MRLAAPHLLPVTMFFGSFAWSFVAVSLPAWTSPDVLDRLLAAIGLACVPLVRMAGTRG